MTSRDANQPATEGGIRLFKVAFDLPREAEDWPPVGVERLWVRKTGVQLEAQVLNTPFFARGIAWGDVVRVAPDHDRRELVYESLVSESGHSTVRIIFMDHARREEIESEIQSTGCSWESSEFEHYSAIDISPEVDYRNLRSYLLRLKSDGVVGIQESAISLVHRRQLPSFP